MTRWRALQDVATAPAAKETEAKGVLLKPAVYELDDTTNRYAHTTDYELGTASSNSAP